MLKIKFKTKKLLREAELKYSTTAFNQMFDIVMKHFENYRDVAAYSMDIPADEVLYTKNKNILSGFIALVELDILKKDLSHLVENWDTKTARFSDEIIKKYLDNYYYPFSFIITNKTDSQGSVSIASTIKKAVMTLNVERIETQDEIKTTLKHELQHLTQIVNGHCLKYYDSLKNNKNDISKVESVPYKLGEKKFGTGKQKTGLKQDASLEDAYANASTPEEQVQILKRYFGDDDEYETWLSEIVEKYFIWLKKNDIITAAQIEAANMKEKVKDKPQEKYKIVKDLSKRYDLSDTDSLRRLNSAFSLYQIATQNINNLLTKSETNENFTNTLPNGHMYSHAIIVLNHLRKKEFVKDLINNLVLKMKKSV